MSKITREQVERAIAATTGDQINRALMPVEAHGWAHLAPRYVLEAWEGKVTPHLTFALYRWRDALDAEREQAEPVCPEGVTVRRESVYIYVDRAGHVRADGSVSVVGSTCADRVALRYLLDLADYRARQHAEGDRQRKLDAVRAAEEALDAASHAEEAAHAAYNDAAKARYAAQSTLCNARREAGL